MVYTITISIVNIATMLVPFLYILNNTDSSAIVKGDPTIETFIEFLHPQAYKKTEKNSKTAIDEKTESLTAHIAFVGNTGQRLKKTTEKII